MPVKEFTKWTLDKGGEGAGVPYCDGRGCHGEKFYCMISLGSYQGTESLVSELNSFTGNRKENLLIKSHPPTQVKVLILERPQYIVTVTGICLGSFGGVCVWGGGEVLGWM